MRIGAAVTGPAGGEAASHERIGGDTVAGASPAGAGHRTERGDV